MSDDATQEPQEKIGGQKGARRGARRTNLLNNLCGDFGCLDAYVSAWAIEEYQTVAFEYLASANRLWVTHWMARAILEAEGGTFALTGELATPEMVALVAERVELLSDPERPTAGETGTVIPFRSRTRAA